MFKSKDSVQSKLVRMALNPGKRQASLAKAYRKRSGVFKFSGGNLDFDPVSGLGHSYSWYEITRVIEGQLVLNSYRYSNTTSRHVWVLRSLLHSLGLKYVEIEAPRGLQRLEEAVQHHARLYAEAVVRDRYARIKHPESVRQAKESLMLARRLAGRGVKVSIKDAVKEAERSRAERLEAKRNQPRFVEATDADRSKPGLHVESYFLSRYRKAELVREAKQKGFTRIYVYRPAEPDAA